jgi:hypothetical protein
LGVIFFGRTQTHFFGRTQTHFFVRTQTHFFVRTQTLSGLPIHFVHRLPQMEGLPKPFQQSTKCFVGFFASPLFTKASF